MRGELRPDEAAEEEEEEEAPEVEEEEDVAGVGDDAGPEMYAADRIACCTGVRVARRSLTHRMRASFAAARLLVVVVVVVLPAEGDANENAVEEEEEGDERDEEETPKADDRLRGVGVDGEC